MTQSTFIPPKNIQYGDVIAHGGCSEVRTAKLQRVSAKVAIKIIMPAHIVRHTHSQRVQAAQRLFANEVKLHQHLQNLKMPNLIGLRGVSRSGDDFIIVMEFAPKGG